jgi:HK97 family phage prohead protease
MNSKHLQASIVKSVGKASTFVATITTDSVDRDGEVVVPSGMNSKDYERNPILLYEHDVKQPIGKMLRMKRMDRGIEAEFALAPRPDNHVGEWFPDTVASLMEFGALNTMSIGFMGIEARPATKADAEKYGDMCKRVYGKWKLLEVSVVSVPANQDAIVTAVRKGLVTATAVKGFGVKVVPDAKPAAAPKPPSRVRVSVSVPAVGWLDRKTIVRDEFARAQGRLYAD